MLVKTRRNNPRGANPRTKVPGFSAMVKCMGLRHMLEKKLRSGLTIAGVAAGVALVLSVTSMNSTLLASTKSSVLQATSTNLAQISSPSPAGLPESLSAQIASTPGVEKAVSLLQIHTEMSNLSSQTPALLIGASGGLQYLFGSSHSSGSTGVFSISGGFGPFGGGIVLSESLASYLGVGIGSEIRVQLASGLKILTVSGIVSGSSISAINGGRFATMLMAPAQLAFGMIGRVTDFFVLPKAGISPSQLVPRLNAVLNGMASATLPGQAGNFLSQELAPFQVLTDLIGLMALFVSLVVVYNTMAMAAAERRRELALAQSLGASPRQVTLTFLAEATLLGVVGTVLGLLGGIVLGHVLLSFAVNAYQSVLGSAPKPTLNVSVFEVALAALSGIVVTVAGALVPSLMARRVQLVEGLKPSGSFETTSGSSLNNRKFALGFGGIVLGLAIGVGGLLGSLPIWLAAIGMLALVGGVLVVLPFCVPWFVRFAKPSAEKLLGVPGRVGSAAIDSNPKRTGFTVATLVLALTMVIGLGASVNSFESKFHTLVTDLSTTPISVQASTLVNYTASIPLSPYDALGLSTVNGVKAVLPEEHAFTSVGSSEGIIYAISAQQAQAQGVLGPAFGSDAKLSPNPAQFMNAILNGNIVVSTLAAKSLNLRVGSSLVLGTPSGKKAFTVGAVFSDLAPADSFFIDRSVYEQDWGDSGVAIFRVVLNPGADTGQVVRGLEGIIHATSMQADVQTRDQSVASLSSSLSQTFSLAKAIELAALIVAGFSVANTALTTIVERKWELGLQRAIGMSKGQLSKTLLVEAVFTGLLGWLGALVAGLAVWALIIEGASVPFGSKLPFTFPFSTVIVALGLGLALVGLATVYPRRVAAKVEIVDSLRYE